MLSPNVQLHAVTVPSGSAVPSVKVQVRLVQEDVNAATGARLGAVTVTGFCTAFVAPAASVTVRVTVYVPPAA